MHINQAQIKLQDNSEEFKFIILELDPTSYITINIIKFGLIKPSNLKHSPQFNAKTIVFIAKKQNHRQLHNHQKSRRGNFRKSQTWNPLIYKLKGRHKNIVKK